MPTNDVVIARPLWTVDAYEAAARAEVLDDGVELIDGDLVAFKVTPQDASHSQTIQNLNVVLCDQYGVRQVRVQMPLALGSQRPEPDLAVVPRGDYTQQHPTTARIVVEVSDPATPRGRYDRTRKAALYASAGIPEYWIVDVATATIEVCTEPTAEDYANRQQHRLLDRFARWAQ